MGKATERRVAAVGDFFGGEVFEPQVEPTGELGVDLGDVRSVVVAGGQRRECDLRVTQQESNQFEGRVSTSPQDAYADH